LDDPHIDKLDLIPKHRHRRETAGTFRFAAKPILLASTVPLADGIGWQMQAAALFLVRLAVRQVALMIEWFFHPSGAMRLSAEIWCSVL
jgi:hypothetical protein